MAIDWNICYRSGLFGIVWDLRGYVSALLVYLSGHNVIEWDAALLCFDILVQGELASRQWGV